MDTSKVSTASSRANVTAKKQQDEAAEREKIEKEIQANLTEKKG